MQGTKYAKRHCVFWGWRVNVGHVLHAHNAAIKRQVGINLGCKMFTNRQSRHWGSVKQLRGGFSALVPKNGDDVGHITQHLPSKLQAIKRHWLRNLAQCFGYESKVVC